MEGFADQSGAAALAMLEFCSRIQDQATLTTTLALAGHSQAPSTLRTFDSGQDYIEIEAAYFLPESSHMGLNHMDTADHRVGVISLIHYEHLRY